MDIDYLSGYARFLDNIHFLCSLLYDRSNFKCKFDSFALYLCLNNTGKHLKLGLPWNSVKIYVQNKINQTYVCNLKAENIYFTLINLKLNLYIN